MISTLGSVVQSTLHTPPGKISYTAWSTHYTTAPFVHLVTIIKYRGYDYLTFAYSFFVQLLLFRGYHSRSSVSISLLHMIYGQKPLLDTGTLPTLIIIAFVLPTSALKPLDFIVSFYHLNFMSSKLSATELNNLKPTVPGTEY